MSALLPTVASPEVPRHQAQKSQLAAYWRANGPAGQPICSSLPAACLWEAGRQPIQVAKVPATGCSRPAGKLAGLASIPICQPVPDERARELGLGISGCQSVGSSKASEPWLFPSFCPTLPHELSDVADKGPKQETWGSAEGHDWLGTRDSGSPVPRDPKMRCYSIATSLLWSER